MVAFFPTPYPDGELLYSVIARYHMRSGNISSVATIEELFGSRTVTAVVDLPANINSLINNLPIGSTNTADNLINKNTLYPFYTAFLSPERAETVMNSMKGNEGKSIHNRTGVMASSIRDNEYLRWCPECVIESEAVHGEPYWKRIHQVPGIIICSKHRTILNDSKVRFNHFNKHEFIPASSEDSMMNSICEASSLLEEVISSGFEHKYYQLVENVENLLNAKYSRELPEWYFLRYLNRLKEMGLANVNGRVNQQEFKQAFRSYYGEAFLKLVQSTVGDNDSSWLSMIVRKPRKTFHPIRHLLIIQFLGMTAEELWSEKYEHLPFGKAPFLCLNPGAEHYLKPVITEMSIRYDNKIKQPIGTFSCSCGFVYARSGPDMCEKDKYRIGRVKNFGNVWEEKLEEFLRMNLSKREIARRLKVDVNTVIKYSQKAKKEVIRCESNNYRSAKEGYRKEWMTLQKKNPGSSKTELRRMDNRLYIWLHRNDKEWLNLNSPMHREILKTSNRVDWVKRDEQIMEATKGVIDSMMQSTEKPERITIGRVGKKVGKSALLEKHLDKLPLTNSYLISKVETVQDFQKRKIRWAIKMSDETDLTWGKVAKKAGIREVDREELAKYYFMIVGAS